MDLQSEWNAVSQMVPRENTTSCDANDRSSYQEALRRRSGRFRAPFLSLEDETGISNAIVNPHLYERNRVAVTRGKILRVEGTLQNQDGVISVKASAVRVLDLSDVGVKR
jgi:DNA polymerase III alpha subunit